MVGKVRTILRETLTWWAEFFSKYQKLLIVLIPLISVGGGGSWFHFSEVEKKDDSILAITEHLHKMGSNVPRETKPITKTIIIKEGCNQCLREIKELKQTYHPQR